MPLETEKAQGQQQPLYTPPGPQPIIFEDFSGGLNTNSTRPGIKDNELWWSDGFFPIAPNYLRTIPDVGAAIYTVENFGPPPVMGCEPASGAAASLILASSFDGGADSNLDVNLLFNEGTNTITNAVNSSVSAPDGSNGVTSCPMVSVDGEVGFVASVGAHGPATISKFDLRTQTKLIEKAQIDPSDGAYRLLCVRRNDNHVFALNIASPAVTLYHLDDDLNVVGSYVETGTETPWGLGAMFPEQCNSSGDVCSVGCGVTRYYMATEPANDGVLVFDISGANPVFLRYVVNPHPPAEPPWDSGTTYAINDVVSYGSGNQINFISQQNGNLNNPPIPTGAVWGADGPSAPGPNTPPLPPVWDAGTTYNASDLVVFGGFRWISLVNSNLGNTPTTAGVWWGHKDEEKYAIVMVGSGGRSVVCDCNDNAFVGVHFGNLNSGTLAYYGLLRIGPNDTSPTEVTPANWKDSSVYLWDYDWGNNNNFNCFNYDLGNKILVIGGGAAPSNYGGGYPATKYRLAGYDASTTPITELWHIDGINSYWGEVSSVITDGQLKMLDWTDGYTHSSSAAIIRTVNTVTGTTISTTPVAGMTNWTSGDDFGFGWYGGYTIDGWAVQSRQ